VSEGKGGEDVRSSGVGVVAVPGLVDADGASEHVKGGQGAGAVFADRGGLELQAGARQRQNILAWLCPIGGNASHAAGVVSRGRVCD